MFLFNVCVLSAEIGLSLSKVSGLAVNQAVSWKKRHERHIFANMCILYKEKFYNAVFIDESTIQMYRNGPRTWFKVMPHENLFGLVGKYKTPSKNSSLGPVVI